MFQSNCSTPQPTNQRIYSSPQAITFRQSCEPRPGIQFSSQPIYPHHPPYYKIPHLISVKKSNMPTALQTTSAAWALVSLGHTLAAKDWQSSPQFRALPSTADACARIGWYQGSVFFLVNGKPILYPILLGHTEFEVDDLCLVVF